MEEFLKILILVMTGCAAVLLLRDGSFRLLAALCCLALCGVLALQLIRPVLDMVTKLTGLAGVSSAVFSPVLRGVAIGILAETAASYCKGCRRTSPGGGDGAGRRARDSLCLIAPFFRRHGHAGALDGGLRCERLFCFF